MDWLSALFYKTDTVPHAVLIFSLVVFLGMLLGKIKILGVKFGIAGVLFSGLIFGHFKFGVNAEVLDFIRDFGLILFVYTVGIQVGPGFFDSLKKRGVGLNLFAILVVSLGAIIAIIIHKVYGINMGTVVGMFSGATTNTPSLGAAQQLLTDLSGKGAEEVIKNQGLAYALAYPFGIFGIIITMLLTKILFSINLSKESRNLKLEINKDLDNVETLNVIVKTPNLSGKKISSLPFMKTGELAISRIKKGDAIKVATFETSLDIGDILYVVGDKKYINEFLLFVGEESKEDIFLMPSNLVFKDILLTKKDHVGKTLHELKIHTRFPDVAFTRINRAGIQFTSKDNIPLKFGDSVRVVGEEATVNRVKSFFGGSLKELEHPDILPIFLGIALGVIIGSIPIGLPGVPVPIKLGLAGGPLLVAIILSKLGNVGQLVWFMPNSANLALREIGIVLFLACVGLKSGDKFFLTLFQGDGLKWMLLASMITFIPLVIVAIIARVATKMNYMTLCGLLSGSMTDPPALQFANAATGSDAPAVAYATVYPLVMVFRIFYAQLLVIFFFAPPI